MRISDWSSDVCSSDLEDLLAVHHDGVVQRAAAGEAHGAHLLDVLCEAEGAGARDIALAGPLAHPGEPPLAADRGACEVDLEADGEAAPRRQGGAAVRFGDGAQR